MTFLQYIIIFFCIASTLACKNTNVNFRAPGENPGIIVLNSRACYFSDAESVAIQSEIKIDTPSCREIEQIQSIMEYVGLPQNFKIYRGNIDNALATMVDNHRYIIYNKDLFTRMDQMSNSYWTSLFIIAHEIGHHLADNISDTSNALNSELDADKFAGFLLYRMGADSNQAISAVASSLISSTQDSKSHPSKNKRIDAVKQSWLESFNLRFMSATPPSLDEPQLVRDHYGFGENWLIFNRYFLNKWGLTRLDYYDDGEDFDESYLTHLPPEKMHLHGIITDVQKLPYDEAYPDVYGITIQVQLTQLDSVVFEGMRLNRRSPFLVFFEPTYSWHSVEDFYKFFVGGRRMEFTAFQLDDPPASENKHNYISNAYAI